jgi:hypothetical protein
MIRERENYMSVTSAVVQATPAPSIEASIEMGPAPDHSKGPSAVADQLRETIRQNVMAWTKWKGVDHAERIDTPIQPS